MLTSRVRGVTLSVAESEPITVVQVVAFAARLRILERNLTDSDRVDLIDALERLVSGCVAAQSLVIHDLESSIRAARAAEGVPAAKRGQGISAQVALACHDSPKRGDTRRGFARTVVEEMPNLFALLQSGDMNQWRATLLIRETACLDITDRARVDAELCADPATLAGLADRQVAARAAALANEYDAAAVVRRHQRAQADRCVSIRPAPDSMAYLTILLPMKTAVSAYASVRTEASSRVADGSAGEATFSQLQADLVAERLIGIGSEPLVPMSVNLTISDKALFGDSEESAWVDNYGPVPAGVARRLIAEAVDADTRVDLRKLYVRPGSGALTAMESSSRYFPKGLAKFIDLRDRTCRTPWCGAPIRHRDHVVSDNRGGKTDADNGAGLCAACNLAKEAPGWSAEVVLDDPSGRHTTEVTTPTGHSHRSVAPAAPTPDHEMGVEQSGERRPEVAA